MLDICNDKNPSEGTTQSEVQCEGSLAVGGYGGVVDCLQGEVICLFSSFGSGWRYDTNFCTRVDQETHTGWLVCDMEKATGRQASEFLN